MASVIWSVLAGYESGTLLKEHHHEPGDEDDWDDVDIEKGEEAPMHLAHQRGFRSC